MKRRQFLKGSLIGLSGLGALAANNAIRAVPPSEKIILATIGLGGRGSHLTRDFAARGDCEFAYLCDLDTRRGGGLVKEIAEKTGRKPLRVTEYRRILDDPAVNAIVVGTPDHWHALPTIHGCQAGKDVYVEKPASHNIWEGRRMVEAARKYKRIVQVGTQTRSAPYARKAAELIRSGALGKVHLCKVFNLKPGNPIPKRPDGKAPPGVDYDRWLGPAPARPFNPNHFHGGWYYFWAYCGGDMGNDGIHQIDLARWLIGRDDPRAVHAFGGNLAFDDARQVPDTQVATFEYDGLILTFEMTNWPPYMKKTNNQIRTGDAFPLWFQNATRIELYGTKNQMIIGRHGGGWQIFTADGKVVDQMYGRFPDAPHKENFIRCIRSRHLPNADIEEGHKSALLAHLGNISYRLGGRALRFDAKRETFTGDREACGLLKREYRAPYVVPERV